MGDSTRQNGQFAVFEKSGGPAGYVSYDIMSGLASSDAAQRLASCESLRQARNIEMALPSIVHMVTQDPDGGVRSCALEVASEHPAQTQFGFSEYIQALKDPDARVQATAAIIFSRSQAVPTEAVSGLSDFVRRETERVVASPNSIIAPGYNEAIKALEKAGTPEATQAIEKSQTAIRHWGLKNMGVGIEQARHVPLEQEIKTGEGRLLSEVEWGVGIILSIFIISALVHAFRGRRD